MNLQQFQTLSKRTMPFNGEPKNPIEFENMLGNYAMGLVGEFHELQWEINKVTNETLTESITFIDKEVGDVLHYCVGLLELLGEKFTYSRIGHAVVIDELEEHLAKILELPKKHIYHRHELNKEEFITSVYEVVAFLYDDFGMKFERILNTNIDKLKTRYPDKFNTADSIKRVDLNE